MGLDIFHCTMHKRVAVVKKAMNERRYFKSQEFMSHEIIDEIIKDLFRMILYKHEM